MTAVQLIIPEQYFSKDPTSSELGRKIISEGIGMMESLGFEDFTFKKLATAIDSTEASLYRYFDNKLKFLLYITTLYWRWVDYNIDYKTHYKDNPEDKLADILKILTHDDDPSMLSEGMDMDIVKLRNVVMTESDKTYLTKQVDEINKEGLFRGYKDLCHKIAMVILEINPDYPYPHAIVSTTMEASHQQAFFARHLPSLTEVKSDEPNIDDQVYEFLKSTLFKILN